MTSVQTLIDLATVKCGTQAELARRCDVPRSHVTDWKSGARPVSPETVATLCDVLQLSGEECREWVAVSMIENPKNAKCADRLRRALFACWALGVAALMQPNDAAARSAGYMARVDSLYIVAHWFVNALRAGVLRRWHVSGWRFAPPCFAG